uniref:Uncharacterized protein n=1 Tax=Candidatus Kentrum sp. TC TaxID=2126339 RepID=A0A451A2R0_9GAMM|nr:MAG: hypothetical protein BECKTC1821F_GA0114240_104416 [Candidatus Kentron sp. TC]
MRRRGEGSPASPSRRQQLSRCSLNCERWRHLLSEQHKVTGRSVTERYRVARIMRKVSPVGRGRQMPRLPLLRATRNGLSNACYESRYKASRLNVLWGKTGC